MVWVPGKQSTYYSMDGGKTWAPSNGYPTVGETSSGMYFRPVADHAVDGYFYTYNFSTGQILESSDGGRTFAVIYSGLPTLPSYASQSQLLSVPGLHRRDLWLGTPNGLWHINGAGASPVKISNVQAANAVGYGAPAPGQNYYAIYIYGEVNSAWCMYLPANRQWQHVEATQ